MVLFQSDFNRPYRAKFVLTILWAAFFLTQPVFGEPQRVVSTHLCTDEYVFRLVPRAHIAALSYLAGDTHPVVSTIAGRTGGIPLIRPSTESVLNLKPDIVVMYQGTETRLHAQLLALGVPVVDVPWANSLADIRKIAAMLGDRLGVPATAKGLLAEMDRKIAAARSAAPHASVKAILYEPNGYASSGGLTDEIMLLSGISNAAPLSKLTRTGTLPVEQIVASAPELLILGGEARIGSARAYMVLRHPALAALKGRTVMEYATLTPLLCPGPWSADAAQTFGDLARKTRALADIPARN